MDVPDAHSAVSGERYRSKMLLHLPNEELTPPGQLWRESAVISLIKPLRKLLQHQTDELSKADLLAEDKRKSRLGILTVCKSFLLGWPLTLACSGCLIWLLVTAGSNSSQCPSPSLSQSAHQDHTNLPTLSHCEQSSLMKHFIKYHTLLP